MRWLIDLVRLPSRVAKLEKEMEAMAEEVKQVANLNAVIDVLATEVPALIAKLDEVLLKLSDNPDVSDQIAAAKDRLAEMAATIQARLNAPSPEESGGNVEGA